MSPNLINLWGLGFPSALLLFTGARLVWPRAPRAELKCETRRRDVITDQCSFRMGRATRCGLLFYLNHQILNYICLIPARAPPDPPTSSGNCTRDESAQSGVRTHERTDSLLTPSQNTEPSLVRPWSTHGACHGARARSDVRRAMHFLFDTTADACHA